MANCQVCDAKISFLGSFDLNSGKVCKICLIGIGFFELEQGHNLVNFLGELKNTSKEEFLARMQKYEENKSEICNFVPTVKGYRIFVDEKNEKWNISKYRRSEIHPIYNFDDILSYEIIQNDTTISSGGVGKAVVGGLLFGGVGAIVGASTGSRTSRTKTNEIYMKIVVNRIENPIEYAWYYDSSYWKLAPKEWNKDLKEIIQHDKAILDNICKKVESKKLTSQDTVQAQSPTSKLVTLKELLDSGLISNEEFESKRKEILDSI